MAMPEVGSFGLKVLTPQMLELTYVNTKTKEAATVSEWNFVGGNFTPQLPPKSDFVVLVNGQNMNIKQVGFKRRALYAPLKQRDLRLGNWLYLELEGSVPDGAVVEVKNPSGERWKSPVEFKVTVDPLRYSPAIHVNQVGYVPGWSKKAMVGYYLGNLGEMGIPATGGFQIVQAGSGQEVFRGSLVRRPDKGYTYSPSPYQQVWEADFSAFQTPGEYRLVVPGMGASFPFWIGDGTAAVFARAYALGLYHQRCGTTNSFPFTRHNHDNCHIAPADVPTADYKQTETVIASVSSDYANEPRHKAPQLKGVNSSLYPFVKKGKVDVSGGHHDAGDYSKYVINSAGLIHHLVFAADAFKGVGELDNLGLPESGDGKSDILQEAKWEADFLAKMQDEDGGFYFLVYPKERRYEDDVTPDHGDPQVVWPKTTAVTAAAVAALAEAGSSPLFKKQFPEAAEMYIAKARKGWLFLDRAIREHGRDGSYQRITHYGDEFMHDDELAWAAAAMFAATGNPSFQKELIKYFDPSDPETRRWTWWRMFEGYGCAVRTFAFAVQTGRLKASQLDPYYLAKCQAEIVAAADDHVRFARESAYGTSLPDPTKRFRTAGWYFSTDRAFDIAVAMSLDSGESQSAARDEFMEAILTNLNYEAGCNPVNMSYITGLGWRRQRDVVHQYAQNDDRILPPSGLPVGNVQAGFQFLDNYGKELGDLSFPSDGAEDAPYPFYDRWGDSFNTTTEFVIVNMARSLACTAFLMSNTAAAASENAETVAPRFAIETFVPPGLLTLGLRHDSRDMKSARIVWDVRGRQPQTGPEVSIDMQGATAVIRVEAEILFPDGSRSFVRTELHPANIRKSLPLRDEVRR